MFKNGITLSKYSWHIKFLKWLYGTSYDDFKNFCPYFWLLIGTFAFLPFILVIRLLLGILFFVYNNDKCEWLITSVTYLGKTVVYLFEVCFALAISTFISGFFILILLFFAEQFINNQYIDALYVALITIAVIIVTSSLIVLLAFLSYKYFSIQDDDEYGDIYRHNKISIAYYKTISAFFYPFKLIKAIFKWIMHKFSEFYKNNCPLINWE